MKEKALHVLSLALIVTAGFAAYADKIAALTFLPPAVAQWWPIVLASAAAINRIALILGDWLDDFKLNGSFVALLALAAVIVALATGCANIPVGRTYSVSYQDGDQEVGVSIHFDPPPRQASDAKTIKPLEVPAKPLSLDTRTENVIDPPGAPFPLIVTRLPGEHARFPVRSAPLLEGGRP